MRTYLHMTAIIYEYFPVLTFLFYRSVSIFNSFDMCI